MNEYLQMLSKKLGVVLTFCVAAANRWLIERRWKLPTTHYGNLPAWSAWPDGRLFMAGRQSLIWVALTATNYCEWRRRPEPATITPLHLRSTPKPTYLPLFAHLDAAPLSHAIYLNFQRGARGTSFCRINYFHVLGETRGIFFRFTINFLAYSILDTLLLFYECSPAAEEPRLCTRSKSGTRHSALEPVLKRPNFRSTYRSVQSSLWGRVAQVWRGGCEATHCPHL